MELSTQPTPCILIPVRTTSDSFDDNLAFILVKVDEAFKRFVTDAHRALQIVVNMPDFFQIEFWYDAHWCISNFEFDRDIEWSYINITDQEIAALTAADDRVNTQSLCFSDDGLTFKAYGPFGEDYYTDGISYEPFILDPVL